MQVIYNKTRDRFEAISRFSEKDIVKGAGFWWDRENKVWYAYKADVAANLQEYFDKTAKEAYEHKTTSMTLSTATDADIDIPAPEGLEYLPFQRAGIQYALMRPSTLIADEMGLGKTVQACGIINATKPRYVVIVCPALLKLNWKNELLRWLTDNYRIDILYGMNGKSQADTYYCNVNAEQIGQITIINYDILKAHQNILTAQKIDLLVADESQYIKSPKAQRTKAVAALAKVAQRKVFLTGTPILNRPVDLFPTLQMFNHKLGADYYKYIYTWCNAYRDRFGMRIGYPTKEQAQKLQAILRESIMIRRMKMDVLKELPTKRRQVVVLDVDSVLDAVIKKEKEKKKEIKQAVKEAKEAVKQAGNDEKAYKEAIQKLKEVRLGNLADIAKLRHETALAKVPHTIQYIDMLLENVDKLVVFTYHKDVLDQIYQNYKDMAVTVSGDNTTQERQEAVQRFQTDDNVRLFLGTIGAAGTGITLTRASHVLFVELDWTPANLAQAEDRVHRIGQQDSVSIYYLVVDRSIDSKLAKTHIKKLEGITRITDVQIEEDEIDIEDVFDDED